MTPLPKAFLTRPLSHRGLHDRADGRPENSLAAFRAAIARGYGIELDLQLSRDGQAIVFHDYELERLTGRKGLVRNNSAEILSQVILIGGDEGIPSLPQVLKLVDGQVPLLIELKDQHGQMGDTGGQLERAVAQTIQGYAGPVAVMSFNPHMVRHLKSVAPKCPRGLVTCGWTGADWPELDDETRDVLRPIPDYETVDAVFVSHDIKDLKNERLKEIKASGGTIFCWTVRSVEAEERARRVADNITFEAYLP